MAASLSSIAALIAALAVAPAHGAPADSARGPVLDTSRVVRRFPPIEVRAPLHDLRSSQTVHVIPREALRGLPVDGLAEAVALQPGVVAEGGELHVRGGRAGETTEYLDGLCLSEPLRNRGMEVPALALESAELVSGAPEAPYACGLAGVLDLRSAAPLARPAAAWRWTSDGGRDTRYDRAQGRLSAPLRVAGLGLAAAADATFDDTALPMLRSRSRHDLFGIPLGWRARNRMLGFARLAPVEDPTRLSAEVLVSREVREPWDPQWTFDGWVHPPANAKELTLWSPVPLPGFVRYRAADHLAITDERRIAAQLSASRRIGPARGTLSLGWLRTREVRSVGGSRDGGAGIHRPWYGDTTGLDPLHVFWGDDPLYRESGSDVLTLRAEGERITPAARVKAGLGVTHEEATLREVEWFPLGWVVDHDEPLPFDGLRTYRVSAPGAFAYTQGRWTAGGLVVNAGLRAEAWTPGAEAAGQTLPGTDRFVLSLSPRLGIAYPVSVRDVFSLAYVRLDQPPARDFLYDGRTLIDNRQPLGNPALRPATTISYEASVKHLLSAEWATQGSVFFRDVFGQVGARDLTTPLGAIDLRYEDQDDGHALGFEWSLVRGAPAGQLAFQYTWLEAWGSESRPEGDPYGTLRADRPAPIDPTPLSWDRRHTFAFSGTWRLRERWSLAWSSTVGSPLPWTPKPRRQPFTDAALVNSARLGWIECTNVDVRWAPRFARGLAFGLEARNLFDGRGERLASVDGYPNPVVNTQYDDDDAYRAETGNAGGAYWVQPPDGSPGYWVPVNDPRLRQEPRTVRMSVGMGW